MDHILIKRIHRDKNYAVQLLKKLIEVPTVNPPGEDYEKMVNLLQKECRNLGLKVRTYLTPQPFLDKFGIKKGSKRISLVCDLNVNARHTLHINSHYDVVPATDKWDTDPFKAVVRGNKIYGRGAEDMKGNIAGALLAVKAIRDLNIKPRINIQLSFTPDEEIGGKTGLGYLVERNFVKADYALSEGHTGEYVSIGNKGVLWIEVSIEGKSSHASTPHKGVNAFDRMSGLVREFEKLKRKVEKRKTGYSMPNDIDRKPTLVMGGYLEGGVKVNVVPGIVRFSIDRRMIPEEDIECVKKEISCIVEKFGSIYSDVKIKLNFATEEKPCVSKDAPEYFKVFKQAVKSVTGKEAKFGIMPGATDNRYFMKHGIPAIGYSARGGDTWHSDNEFVYIDGILDMAKVYGLVMVNLKDSY